MAHPRPRRGNNFKSGWTSNVAGFWTSPNNAVILIVLLATAGIICKRIVEASDEVAIIAAALLTAVGSTGAFALLYLSVLNTAQAVFLGGAFLLFTLFGLLKRVGHQSIT